MFRKGGQRDEALTASSPRSERAKAALVLSGGRNGFMVDSAEAASLWPVKGPAPLPGAILPAKRIVAYYGNPLSKRMGILGEVPPDEMLTRLEREVTRWEKADPSTPVQPALPLHQVAAPTASAPPCRQLELFTT